MSVFKCKMCGGTLEFEQGATIGVCEYCGSKQTLPRLDNDRRANLYDRANHFRRNNEFDKAMSIYEQILNEDKTDAEAYWSLVLCRYGIEYVEDPATHKRIPTVNRAQFTAIFDDDNYKSALQYADVYQRAIYEDEAKTINEIQKSILAISQKEEPFDVFICYKETDQNGRRTPDSVLANDLYHQLKQEGFKVFFARITLEDKLGSAYEPYIFAALNSAKVMVVLGTKPEYFNAVWVKNEWSRYLALVKASNGKKVLIPAYRDMDPYDLPEEFSHLQAQDMSKLGFMQDLIRGIKKIARSDEPKATVKETVIVGGGNATVAPLLKRAFMFLEDGNWQEADAYCEKVLDQEPENAQAYVGKLMVELRVRKQADLGRYAKPFEFSDNYRKAIRFGDESLTTILKGYIQQIRERLRQEELAANEAAYTAAVEAARIAQTEKDALAAAKLFDPLIEKAYKDAAMQKTRCLEKAEAYRIEELYVSAVEALNQAQDESHFLAVASQFDPLIELGYKDSAAQKARCLEKAEVCRKDRIYWHGISMAEKNDLPSLRAAEENFRCILGWRDADIKLSDCQLRIKEMQAKIKAEQEAKERREEEERIKAEKKRKKKRILIISSASLVLTVIAAVVVFINIFLPMIRYNQAISLYEEGKYAEAIDAFLKLDNYSNSSEYFEKSVLADGKYATAIEQYNAGNYLDALSNFYAARGYGESTSYVRDILQRYKRNWIGLLDDDNICKVLPDGTLMTYSNDEYETYGYDFSSRTIASWTDISFVVSNKDIAVGLKKNGTVVVAGRAYSGENRLSETTLDWDNIVDVAACRSNIAGLKRDGTVVMWKQSYGYDNITEKTLGWTDITAVACSVKNVYGLKSDGTVVTTSDNVDVSGMNDIVSIAVARGTGDTDDRVIGLKRDGTVVTAGQISKKIAKKCAKWKNIVEVYINSYYIIGLKSDGTVVIEKIFWASTPKVGDWKNIINIVCNGSSSGGFLGIQKDGSVVTFNPGKAESLKNASQWTVPYWTDTTPDVGDIISFGSYEQDNNASNGKENIEWIVLAKENNQLLVTSLYALDCQPYHTAKSNETWETCSLRKWLNETFLNDAFSMEEQNRLVVTTVTADANPSWTTPQGNDTNDRVFLFSSSEATQYFASDKLRKCAPTAYAIAQGADTNDSNCWWWLRTRGGGDPCQSVRVTNGGSVENRGVSVDTTNVAVRPVLWIKLDP